MACCTYHGSGFQCVGRLIMQLHCSNNRLSTPPELLTPCRPSFLNRLVSASDSCASSLPHPSECTPFEMRGPPPAWMPPHPPDREHDYENNYEDPEDCRERGEVG
ncbi:unnamed protein product [Haemonchus placei]|uniref:ORF3 n=1 Tax=Haemonchus placei TaxID=6290 RepID=A0A0N4VYC2_HAEPC|nr:unnamed protein product [Haemonchus placei]